MKHSQDQALILQFNKKLYNRVSFSKIIESSDGHRLIEIMSVDGKAKIYGSKVSSLLSMYHVLPLHIILDKQDLGRAVSICWTLYVIYHVKARDQESKTTWKVLKLTHLPERQQGTFNVTVQV